MQECGMKKVFSVFKDSQNSKIGDCLCFTVLSQKRNAKLLCYLTSGGVEKLWLVMVNWSELPPFQWRPFGALRISVVRYSKFQSD